MIRWQVVIAMLIVLIGWQLLNTSGVIFRGVGSSGEW